MIIQIVFVALLVAVNGDGSSESCDANYCEGRNYGVYSGCKCNEFIVCYQNQKRVLECDEGDEWNPNSRQCVTSDAQSTCNVVPSDDPCDPGYCSGRNDGVYKGCQCGQLMLCYDNKIVGRWPCPSSSTWTYDRNTCRSTDAQDCAASCDNDYCDGKVGLYAGCGCNKFTFCKDNKSFSRRCPNNLFIEQNICKCD